LTPYERLLKLQELHYGDHTVEEFNEGTKLSRKETIERLRKKYQKESTPEELEEFEKDLRLAGELENEIELPTKYQDVPSFLIISNLSKIIQRGISTCHLIHKETRKVTKLTKMNFNFNPPKFGTIHFGDLSACTYPCDNNENLIVFEVELSTFCFLLCKIIVPLFPVYDPTSNNTLEDYKKIINEKIAKNPEPAQRFEELITAYVTTGRATKAPLYEIAQRYNNFLSALVQAMEVFIMGHECSHVLLHHTEKGDLEKRATLENMAYIRFSWNQEYEADNLALPLTLAGLHDIGFENDFINYCGAETFFSGLEIIERAKCLVNSGDDTWYWRNCSETGPISDHPPSDDRRKKLRDHMKGVYGEKSLESSLIVENIIKELWMKTKPNLVKNRISLLKKSLSYQVDQNTSQKNYSKALELLDEILQLDDKFLPALFGKGNIFLLQNKFQEANQQFELILKIDKNNIDAIIHKAMVSFAEEDYSKSLELANQALEKDNKNFYALLAKGKALDLLNRFEDSIECFNLILNQEKNNQFALFRIGFAYFMLDKPEKALEYYNKVLEINPHHEGAIENKFMALDFLKNYDEAIKMIDKFLEETPGDLDLLEIKKELEKEKQNQKNKNGD